jgi:NAD(P)-dependent dehydrogenase (short-subunit alcohol dehydrogenase family)
MKRLNGKVAIVAGAGRGIGRVSAKLFAAKGAKVAILSLTPANVDSVVSEMNPLAGPHSGSPATRPIRARSHRGRLSSLGGLIAVTNLRSGSAVKHTENMPIPKPQRRRPPTR